MILDVVQVLEKVCSYAQALHDFLQPYGNVPDNGLHKEDSGDAPDSRLRHRYWGLGLFSNTYIRA